jgi:phage terminase small subunit
MNARVTPKTYPWPAGDPTKPADLTPDASREWDRVCRYMRRQGTLSPAYWGVVYAAASGCAAFKRMLRHVRTARITAANGKGVLRHMEAMRKTYLRAVRSLRCPPARMVLNHQPGDR